MPTNAPDEISIIHKAYDFYLALNKVINTIPKKDRFTIGVKIEKMSLDLIINFYQANHHNGRKRLEILDKADLKLKVLNMLVRALHDLEDINNKKYLRLEARLKEIGRMLGGWIKETHKF
ncbi:MAG: diversity-generating retroelement protein Avd [Patescibacteria group bacterium]|nr:diversity-generating retroelement protein Avd [Patescibacteria group bacterium]